MAISSTRWSEPWRVLAYSAAAALAFVALERLELALFDAAGADRLLTATRSAGADERLAAEAADVAARSARAVIALPAGHREAAFRLGYELGWASELVGSFAMSDPAAQRRAAAIADAHVALARSHARRLGIEDPDRIVALPSRTLADFVRLQARFEADEGGVAQRVEARLTPLHRHLFLLGASVGGEAAKVQSSGGSFSQPPVETIRRHATLAGIDPAVWQPLVEVASAAPSAAVERQRAAVERVVSALAARDGADARTSSSR
jgi:hypothetical protein